ncbi:MAG: CDF family Co(II)/Ni(II) efflux transporter DmeF [Pseudomonadota bacterium]
MDNRSSSPSLENWKHGHDFSYHNEKGERRTLYVLIITAVTMVLEIVFGSISGSMALLADGWHMATHVVAFAITLFTYRYARKNANNPMFSFGTGKVNVLGAFASAIALAVVALFMVVESIHRFFEPQEIRFTEAIVVSCVGLAVNLVGALLLKDDHHHQHTRADAAARVQPQDHNLRAAYVHVLADALTSFLAIFALLAGKLAGLNWCDPLMGIVGAVMITRWSVALVKQTSPILLDKNIEESIQREIIEAVENNTKDRVSDIHVWKVDATHYSAIIAVVTQSSNTPEYYKSLLAAHSQIAHLTVEVNNINDNIQQPT